MDERFERTARLITEEGVKKLKNAKIALFGVGGVGGHVLEALVRSGAENVDVFDADVVSVSNLNRQIIATKDTVGREKAHVARERAISINPDAKIGAYTVFYSPENSADFDLSAYDYIVDAIDSVRSKIELIVKATEAGTKIISSMGTGNKLDPTRFEVSDIYKTSVCPLARALRGELKKRGVKSLKVVYSKEEPICAPSPSGERTPASCAFVPSVAGLIIASEIIKDIAIR